ncbi:unnamed protein product [Ophioblennius macclurei]
MRWMLIGCCSLALISLTVAAGNAIRVMQRPRFYGVRTGSSVIISCVSQPSREGVAEWFKAVTHDAPLGDRTPVQKNHRVSFMDKDQVQNALLVIMRLQVDDSAVYFCKINGTPGPGTHLQAAKPIDLAQAQYRTQMKDGLMVLQALVLAASVARLLLRKRTLVKRRNSLYEEPDADHIYQGLEVGECDGGLYEELAVYAEADGAEAPWE